MRTSPAQLPTPASGVALFAADFERTVARLRAEIDLLADAEVFETLAAPPVIARSVVERAGYVREFANLLGTVHHFGGGPSDWLRHRPQARPGGDWHVEQAITDVVLTPAACYHVYPQLAGSRVDAECRYGVEAHCYRHEATDEVGRLRSFRMRELIFFGAPDAAVKWRGHWLDKMADWLSASGLDVSVEVASDPFFGPGARLMRNSQLDKALKYELVVPVADGIRQAVASANCHKEHFGEVFEIGGQDGGPAHSACAAFGMERIALALCHAGKA
jgi:seryl-tRNA synthetase